MPQATLPFMAGDPSSPLPPLFILRCSPCPRRRSHSWLTSRSFSLRHALRYSVAVRPAGSLFLFVLRCRSPAIRAATQSLLNPAPVKSFNLLLFQVFISRTGSLHPCRDDLRWLMHHMRRCSTHDVFKKGGPVGT
ncbi:hypothetical protein VPH35_021799 [Triticum aestivum]